MGMPINFFYHGANIHGMSDIGNRIRELRKRHKLNQTDLAELVGCDQSVISDMENGRGFGAKYLLPLARALQTSPEYIMGESEESPDVDGFEDLLAYARTLSTEQMKTLLEVARGLYGLSSKQPKKGEKRRLQA